MAPSSDTFGSKYHIYLNNIKIKIISLIIFIQAYLLSNRIFPSDPIYRSDQIRVMKLGKVLLKPNPNRNWVEVELITNSLLLLFT